MIRINSMHISMVYLWVSMAIPMCMALMSIVCKIDPPPLQLYGIAGEDVFLHGYVTVYVSSYYVSLVVSYYDATAVLDVDALLSFLRHVSFYQCINICIYTFISFIFCVVFY